MDTTRWLILKSDWLYSLMPKMEKLYTVSNNKTGSCLWLISSAPYCKIQTQTEVGKSIQVRVGAQLLQSCLTLCDPMDYSLPGILSMGFSGKDTGVGCHALLQRIFLTQGSNPCLCLLHLQVGSLPLEPKSLMTIQWRWQIDWRD